MKSIYQGRRGAETQAINQVRQLWVQLPHSRKLSGNEIFNVSCPCSGNEAQRDVKFRYSTCNMFSVVPSVAVGAGLGDGRVGPLGRVLVRLRHAVVGLGDGRRGGRVLKRLRFYLIFWANILYILLSSKTVFMDIKQ